MQLTIGKKILICFGLIILIFIGNAYYTRNQLYTLHLLQEDIVKRMTDATAASRAERLGGEIYRVIADAQINRNLDETKKNWDEIKAEALKEMDFIKKTLDHPDEKARFAIAETKMKEMADLFEKQILAILGSTDVAFKAKELRELDGKIDTLIDEMSSPLKDIKDSYLKEADNADKTFDATYSDMSAALIKISVFVIALLAVINIFFSRSVTFIISSMLGETERLVKAAGDGKLDARADESKVNFEFRGLITGFNRTLDELIAPLNVSAEYMDRISKGDIPPKITDEYKGDFNEIKNNINGLIDNLNNFAGSMNKMYEEQKAGDFESFMDEKRFAGAYRKMAEGVNFMVKFHVDSILLFFKVVSSYSEGDFTATLPKFPGKAAVANQIMDSVRDNLKGVVSETLTLVNAAVEGKLSARGNAANFKGGFREIVDGMNKTLDAIVGPLDQTAKCLEEMAKGNLAVAMEGDYNGEYALLKNSLNATINSMNEILTHVNVAVEQVNNGARQVSDASQSLSQCATEAASSLEEISASMHEINSQTKLNADNASQANQLASKTRGSAEEGNEKMRNMLTAMRDINEAAGNISKIIKAIDEIAFQTNLLALNAAVEAARAGKHGKGFTVVAEEVRNLAQRSAKAAKETAEMIENSIKKTEHGTRIADDTSRSLQEIVGNVTKVSDLVGEIAAASKEQAQGIIQINQGLSKVDQVTQQNTATAEEAAAASEELSSQSVELRGMISKFTLQNNAIAYNEKKLLTKR